jgi:hypothetical protein
MISNLCCELACMTRLRPQVSITSGVILCNWPLDGHDLLLAKCVRVGEALSDLVIKTLLHRSQILLSEYACRANRVRIE